MNVGRHNWSNWNFLNDTSASLSASLQSLLTLTTSTRELLSGCFHWGRDVGGCFKKRENPSDGAWFDCDQFKVETPYCYDNEALSDIVNEETSSISMQPIETMSVNSTLETSIQATPNREDKNDSDAGPNEAFLLVTDSRKYNLDCHGERINELHSYKPVVDSVLPMSFASFIKCQQQTDNILRSEGTPQTEINSKLKRKYYKSNLHSPVLDKRKILPCDVSRSSLGDVSRSSLECDEGLFEYEENKNSNSAVGEVWDHQELEDAFHHYNASSHSFHFSKLVMPRKSKKLKRSYEKFEDIFPPNLNAKSFEENNNCFSERFIENNVCEGEQNGLVNLPKNCLRKKYLKQEYQSNILTDLEMRNIIKNCFLSGEKTLVCDKVYKYRNKSFNMNLIYDLVSESRKDYFNSYLISNQYEISNHEWATEALVFSSLNFEENCKPYRLALSEDADKIKQKLLKNKDFNNLVKVPNEILIENVTSKEIIKEGLLWQNIDNEIEELKVMVANDIFEEFLNKEIEFLNSFVH